MLKTIRLCYAGTTVVRVLETAQGKPISTLGMKLMKKAYVKAIESNLNNIKETL